MRTETVSVGKKHYEDMAMLVYEERVAMPMVDLLYQELTELKITRNGKNVDHPRKLSKDLADAVCGAIYGAISHTPKDLNPIIEIHDFSDRRKSRVANMNDDVIQFKSRQMPDDVKEYLGRFDLI
jgi:hypothetical protein